MAKKQPTTTQQLYYTRRALKRTRQALVIAIIGAFALAVIGYVYSSEMSNQRDAWRANALMNEEALANANELLQGRDAGHVLFTPENATEICYVAALDQVRVIIDSNTAHRFPVVHDMHCVAVPVLLEYDSDIIALVDIMSGVYDWGTPTILLYADGEPVQIWPPGGVTDET